MVSVFPETYFLIALFSGITIWLMVTEGLGKKIVSIVTSLFLIVLVNSATVSYVLIDEHRINFTEFKYEQNKVVNATNTFIDPAISRITTTQLSSIQDILQYFSVILTVTAIGLLLMEIVEMNEARKSRKAQEEM